MILYKFFLSLIYFLFYPLWVLIYKKRGFKQRTSFRNFTIEKSIWIHTASVSEVIAVKPLIKRLFEAYNKKTILMTCMTQDGLSAAKEISGKLFVHPFPLDVPHIMKRAFKYFEPTLIILVETEILPCMLNQAYKNKTTVILINAKISQKLYKRYNYLKWFLRKEFSVIKLICTQSENDTNKYEQIKFQNVVTTGNLKFSIDLPEYETYVLRHAWNYQFNDFIIALGSSRPGEEMLIKEVYHKLISLIPRLKVIIAPKQLQNIPEILPLFDREEYALFSESDTDKPFLIMDEMGLLPQIYALCDVSIIGGSFYDFGGDNPLEAIWYEKPVIVGQFHQSCLVAVEKFMNENAIIVSSVEELFNNIYTLYQNYEHRKNIGKKAKNILLENKDAIENHWVEIVKFCEM